MKLRGALSISRDKILEFKAEALKELMRGLLTVTRLNFPKVRLGFTVYLQSLGLHPDDDSVLAWLQENTGPFIAAFIFDKDGKLDFLLTTGTQAELKQIGIINVEESSDTQGTASVGQVHVG